MIPDENNIIYIYRERERERERTTLQRKYHQRRGKNDSQQVVTNHEQTNKIHPISFKLDQSCWRPHYSDHPDDHKAPKILTT
jgi:hypothetical protein